MLTFVRHAGTAALALALGGLAACSEGDGPEPDPGKGRTIALLLPESETARYETNDRPLFEQQVAKLCADCTVTYGNAGGDAQEQERQLDEALDAGAKVVVLDPVDGRGAAAMVSRAHEAGAEVIAYDRFVASADYYVSFENETVGRLQAEALVEAMDGKGGYLMINGSPQDPNAAEFRSGAQEVLRGSGLTLLGEYDNPDWSAEKARKYVARQIDEHGLAAIKGVLAANDGEAGGAIAALKAAGLSTNALPPVTGQDAEEAAVLRILAGEQTMTVYKPFRLEPFKAAEIAVALLDGEAIDGTTDVDGVPSFIFDPVVVTQDNLDAVVPPRPEQSQPPQDGVSAG